MAVNKFILNFQDEALLWHGGSGWIVALGWLLPALGPYSAVGWSSLIAYGCVARVPTMRDGVLWAGCAVGVPMWLIGAGGATLLAVPAGGARVLLLGMVMLMSVFYGGLWAILVRRGISMCAWIAGDIGRARLWGGMGATFVWWILVEYSCLWWIGWDERLPMILPIVPLVEWPCFVPLFGTLGRWGVMGVVMGASAAVVDYLRTPRIWQIVLMSAIGLGWMALAVWQDMLLKERTTVTLPLLQHVPLKVGLRVSTHLATALCTKAAHGIDGAWWATAESAVYYPGAGFGERPSSSSYSGRAESSMGLVGGFRSDGQELYNTLWWIVDGRVVAWFDKQVLMPFTEVVPWRLSSARLARWCMGTARPLSRGRPPRPLWELVPGVRVVPYLCAELLCATTPRDTYSDAVILALCNTEWAVPAVRQRIHRMVTMSAVTWCRPIYYVADEGSRLVLPSGYWISLPGSG